MRPIEFTAEVRVGRMCIPPFVVEKGKLVLLIWPGIMGSRDDLRLSRVLEGRRRYAQCHVSGRIAVADACGLELPVEMTHRSVGAVVGSHLADAEWSRFRELFFPDESSRERPWISSGKSVRLALWMAILSRSSDCICTNDAGLDPGGAANILRWGQVIAQRGVGVLHVIYGGLRDVEFHAELQGLQAVLARRL